MWLELDVEIHLAYLTTFLRASFFTGRTLKFAYAALSWNSSHTGQQWKFRPNER